jgi:chemotaxis protein histidine kinase CheA
LDRRGAAFAEDLEALRGAYARELPEKARSVAVAARRVAERWDEAGREDLFRQVHRLSGSAAIYGFPAVSSAATALEDYVEATRGRRAPRASERKRALRRLTDALLRSLSGESPRAGREERQRSRSATPRRTA